jgi:hypothetical protein
LPPPGTALEAAASDAATLWLALLSSGVAFTCGAAMHVVLSQATNSRAV